MDSELKTPYKISLDFYIRKIITVNAKQLDSDSRVINITCTENGKKFFVDSSTTSAFVRYKKSDGHSVLNQVDILSDGTVNLELSQQMLAVEGRQLVDIMLINKSELEVYTSSISVEDDDNGNVTVIEKQTANVSDLSVEEILEAITENGISVLSTMSFYINTEGVAIDGSQIESSYEYNALIDGLGKMVAVDRRLVQVEENAEYAIQKCNTVTNGANTATNTANNATKNANDATQRANTAAKNAEDVTSEAKTATQACQEIIDKVASIEDFDKIDEILNYKIEVTQEEYDALSDEEKNNGKIYFITDVYSGGTATEVFYNNTKTGFKSANIQDVIDELNEKVEIVDKEKVDKSNVVNNLTSTEEGFVLDARQGKVLKDEITDLSPQFAYLWLSTATSIEAGGTIPFNNQVTKGNAFSVSNGIITVEEDLEYVRVSATLGGAATTNRCWMRIMRNGTTVYDALVYGQFFSPSGAAICKASKGDTFSVISNEAMTAKSGGVGCYFNIEKLC